MSLTETLFAMQDKSYRDFQIPLLATVDPERIIGVRTPQLRALAKEMKKTGEDRVFLGSLPHAFFEEDQLHAFLISLEKDPETCLVMTDAFLPYIGNWATCDQLRPAALAKDLGALDAAIRRWLASGQVYTVRFAYGMRMAHFLGDAFFEGQFEETLLDVPDDYYVHMMIAWYLATALAMQRDAALTFLGEGRLDAWTHNRTIQKAVESRRISDEDKILLRSMKRQI